MLGRLQTSADLRLVFYKGRMPCPRFLANLMGCQWPLVRHVWVEGPRRETRVPSQLVDNGGPVSCLPVYSMTCFCYLPSLPKSRRFSCSSDIGITGENPRALSLKWIPCCQSFCLHQGTSLRDFWLACALARHRAPLALPLLLASL